MNVLVYLVPMALALGLIGLAAFLWSMRTGQYDDLDGAALRGDGVALVPVSMFRRELERGDLVQPFGIEADLGGYWLTRLMSRAETRGMALFRNWLLAQC